MEYYLYHPPSTSTQHPIYRAHTYLWTYYQIHTFHTAKFLQNTHTKTQRQNIFHHHPRRLLVYTCNTSQNHTPRLSHSVKMVHSPKTCVIYTPHPYTRHNTRQWLLLSTILRIWHVAQHSTRLKRAVASRSHLLITLTTYMYHPYLTIHTSPQTTFNNILLHCPT